MPQHETFRYDVALIYFSQHASAAGELQRALEGQGFRVWSGAESTVPGDSSEKIEDALDLSRVLILILPEQSPPEAQANVERYTLPFRDILNSQRRFIPVRIKDAPIPSFLRNYGYLEWSDGNESKLRSILDACRRPAPPPEHAKVVKVQGKQNRVVRGHFAAVRRLVLSPDGRRAVSGAADQAVRIWNLENDTCVNILDRHRDTVTGVALTQDVVASVSADATLRIFEVTGKNIFTHEGQSGPFSDIASVPDGSVAVVGSLSGTLELWNLRKRKRIRVLTKDGPETVRVAISRDGKLVLSTSTDGNIYAWDTERTALVGIMSGHTDVVNSVAVNADKSLAWSASSDRTVRLWDVNSLKCVAALEGHTGAVRCVAASDDGRTAVSGATDGTIRFWRFTRGECAAAFYAHEGTVSDVAISSDATVAISAGVEDRELRIWSVPTSEVAAPPAEGTTRYTNAKVLLVGDTGVGKTGLALRLAENRFHATVSTDGVWATQLKLSHGATEDGVEREIWLWDFGGQADYRLIHQLFMDETALALLVFNPQIDDPFEGLNQWDRDLTRAARRSFKKLLIAGRCDRGGLTVSKASVDRFCAEKGYSGFFETSARTGSNCDHLRKKIIEAITWEEIPWRSSPRLFKQLKDAIIQLKDEGHLLLRAVELKQQIQLRAVEEEFSLKELRAVIALLAGPGVVWQLEFGDFVLLRPEIINSYAAAVIRSVRSHTDEIGCIEEERVLSGNLIYHDFKRLEKEEEQIILRAMHQLFIGRGLCLREQTEWGSQLIFPAYFKRERTDIGRHPANLVSYTFAGQAEDIYATLVVKLHHTPVFEKDQLWRFAADFKTQEGKRLGLKMAKCSDGSATITVYSEPSVSDDTKVTFIRYVHDHLKAKDPDVIRVRHYVCPNPKCGEGVEGARAVQKALEGGKKFIVCQFCNKKIPLTDLIERKFASMQLQRHVRDLGEKARISIDNESKELILVGHTLATVAEAGQIFRPTPNSDWGIDGEIEFKDESGNASGSRVYVQLKSGDSYLTVGRDRKEIFRIKNPRHVEYWTSQPCPVILVVRSSDGNTRWINISLALKMAKKKNKPLNKVVFEGIPFDVEHILQLREEMVPVKQP